MTLKGSCHCGAVQLSLSRKPTQFTECNCSVCYRYGARWVYGTARTVNIDSEPDVLRAYRWGDGTIDFYHCSHCGCLTHYRSTQGGEDSRLAVNARMLMPAQVADVRVRLFDGAESWQYLD